MGISMPRRKGFTLIELLVVIAIIAILAAILFPVFLAAKAAGQKTKCLSGAKQLANACTMYEGDFEGWMVPGFTSANWGGWYESINPYLRQMNNNGAYQLRGVYLCPSIPYSIVKSTNKEISADVKRCYGYNCYYLGKGYDAATNKWDLHKSSELAKASSTIRILEIWGFGHYDAASKGWGTAYCYPYGKVPRLCDPSQCWPPGWHSGSSVVAWCDGHVSMTRAKPPRPLGNTGQDADYTGVMQKFTGGKRVTFADPDNPDNADPYFRLKAPKP